MKRKAIFTAFVIVSSILITNKLAPILIGPEPSEEAAALAVFIDFYIWFVFQVIKFFFNHDVTSSASRVLPKIKS